MTGRTEAVEALLDLGLTEYEARCFVALTQLSEGTAKEVSQVADVPQSRVYDVTEELHRRGLVDIQESDPRKYFALPVEEGLRRLRQEYDDALETAGRHLESLESRHTESDGVWEIADREDVVNRVVMHVGDAEEEVYLFVADEQLLEAAVLDSLSDASDRAAVYVEVPSEAARARVREAGPDCSLAVSDLPLESTSPGDRKPGRLLMVDRATILMSALREGLVPDDVDESGVWGSEVGHGLVAWLRPVLVDRLGRLEFESD